MTIFLVWCPEYGQEQHDGRLLRACDAEAAARSWAMWSDASSADYTIVSGTPAEVRVMDTTDLTTTDWTVTGETRPYYIAMRAA